MIGPYKGRCPEEPVTRSFSRFPSSSLSFPFLHLLDVTGCSYFNDKLSVLLSFFLSLSFLTFFYHFCIFKRSLLSLSSSCPLLDTLWCGRCPRLTSDGLLTIVLSMKRIVDLNLSFIGILLSFNLILILSFSLILSLFLFVCANPFRPFLFPIKKTMSM